MKALGMLSGGLDSQLALKLIKEQGIELEAFHYQSVFDPQANRPWEENSAYLAAQHLGIPIHVEEISLDLLERVKKPLHGHGAGLNPCVDCRIMTFSKAKEYMAKTGAEFLVTGEVLGSRPMSQFMKALLTIEKESGLEGLVVRPLSAQVLPLSLPEQRGWVDREKFLSISGRSRKIQIELAKELGIINYPNPAGGCLLAETLFVPRLERLLEENSHPDLRELNLVKIGRQLITTTNERVIIPRDQEEDDRLQKLIRPNDLTLRLKEVLGPTCLIVNPNADEATVLEAASLLVRYSKARKETSVKVLVGGAHPWELLVNQ